MRKVCGFVTCVSFVYFFILSNKNAEIDKVANIALENTHFLDLSVAMDFDNKAVFRDGVEEHISYTSFPTLLLSFRPQNH